MKTCVYLGNSWTADWEGRVMWRDSLEGHPLTDLQCLMNYASGGAMPDDVGGYEDGQGTLLQVQNLGDQVDMFEKDRTDPARSLPQPDFVFYYPNGNALLIALMGEALQYELGGTLIRPAKALLDWREDTINAVGFEGMIDAAAEHTYHKNLGYLQRLRSCAPGSRIVVIEDWNVRQAPLCKDVSGAGYATNRFDTELFTASEGVDNCVFISQENVYIPKTAFDPDGIHGNAEGDLARITAGAVFRGLI